MSGPAYKWTTVRKLWRQTENSLPFCLRNPDRCCTRSELAVEGDMMLSLESERVFQDLLLFFVLFCYITNHLMTGREYLNETLRFSGNKIHCSPRDQSLSVKYISLLLSAYLQYSWNRWWSFVSCVYPSNVCAKDKLKGTITCLLEDITY